MGKLAVDWMEAHYTYINISGVALSLSILSDHANNNTPNCISNDNKELIANFLKNEICLGVIIDQKDLIE